MCQLSYWLAFQMDSNSKDPEYFYCIYIYPLYDTPKIDFFVFFCQIAKWTDWTQHLWVLILMCHPTDAR